MRRKARIIVTPAQTVEIQYKRRKNNRNVWVVVATLLYVDIDAALDKIHAYDRSDKRKTHVTLIHTGYYSTIDGYTRDYTKG